MRVIARRVIVDFWGKHPEARVSLERWHTLVRAAQWNSTDEVHKAAPKAKVLNRERVRFEVAGGNYRLVVAFDFRQSREARASITVPIVSPQMSNITIWFCARSDKWRPVEY